MKSLFVTFDYDARGRAILITDSFGRCYGAVYDERDLILERTDALGRTTNLDFGLRRELLAVVAPVEPSVTEQHTKCSMTAADV